MNGNFSTKSVNDSATTETRKEPDARATSHRLELVILAVGVLLRLALYLHNRSLWSDEASLALNIVHRDIPGLFRPLDYDQVAPPGFVLLEKIFTLVFGTSELALRAVPLLAGTAALLLFLRLTRKFLDSPARLVALGLFAISPVLTYYASEAKQYSTDVLVCEIILLVSLRFRAQPSQRNGVVLAIVGVIAPWFSYPALILLASCYALLILETRSKRLRIPAGVFGLSVLGLWATFLRHAMGNDYLHYYWDKGFVDLNASGVRLVLAAFRNPLTVYAIAAIPLMLLGARRRDVRTLYLLTPIVVAIVLSVLQRYPFRDRLILFLAPLFFLLIACGLNELFEARVVWQRRIAAIATVVLFWYPAYRWIRFPRLNNQELRPVLEHVMRNRLPGDAVYVLNAALEPFDYYASRISELQTMPIVRGNDYHTSPEVYLWERERIRARRFWFVATNNCLPGGVDEQAELIRGFGKHQHHFRAYDADAYLFLNPIIVQPGSHGLFGVRRDSVPNEWTRCGPAHRP